MRQQKIVLTKRLVIPCALMLLLIHAQAVCNITQNTGLVFNCPISNTNNCRATANLGLYCNPAANVNISLTQGNSNQYLTRQLKDLTHGNTANYNIFVTSANNQIFGNGAQGSGPIVAQCQGNCNYTIYGSILSNTIQAGSYTDTPLLIISYQ